MPIRYYFHPMSPNCRKVTALLEHLGVDAERILVDLPKGEHRSPAFLALNPNGKVPTLVDGDTAVWESNAILIHLAGRTGSDLWPADDRRIHVLKWMFWEQGHFMWATGMLFFERVLKPMLGQAVDDAKVEEGLGMFRRLAAVLDGHLEHERYLVAGSLSLADLAVGADLSFADAAGIPVGEFPHLDRWHRSLDELPAWRASAPPPLG